MPRILFRHIVADLCRIMLLTAAVLVSVIAFGAAIRQLRTQVTGLSQGRLVQLAGQIVMNAQQNLRHRLLVDGAEIEVEQLQQLWLQAQRPASAT